MKKIKIGFFFVSAFVSAACALGQGPLVITDESTPIPAVAVNGMDFVLSGQATTLTQGNTVTWYFTSGLVISPGGSYPLTLRSSVPIQAAIASANDIIFTDGLDPAAITGLSPDIGTFPLKLIEPAR